MREHWKEAVRVTLRGREERRNLETLLLEAEVVIEAFVKINSTETQKKINKSIMRDTVPP